VARRDRATRRPDSGSPVPPEAVRPQRAPGQGCGPCWKRRRSRCPPS